MIAVVINALAVVLGALAGLFIGDRLKDKYSQSALTAIALCTLGIGAAGFIKGNNVLVSLLSLVIGGGIGTLLDIDGALTRLGQLVERRLTPKAGLKKPLATGFVTASLLFCVGAMTVVGALEAGIKGDTSLYILKSGLDAVASVPLAASLGAGVLLSSVFVLGFQGALVLLSTLIAPLLSAQAIADMGATGSLLILAIGLNLLGLTRIRVADYLPALVLAPFLSKLASLLMG